MTPIILALALAADPDPDAVALARSATDLSAALTDLKHPLPAAVQAVIAKGDSDEIDEALKPHVFLATTINPEGRVKVARGAADAAVAVGESLYAVVRVENQSGGQQTLTAHGSYTGADRSPFDVRFASAGKITPALSGRLVEYRVLRVTCSAAGKRELTISFDAGQGTQDLGFRGEVPVLFTVTARR